MHMWIFIRSSVGAKLSALFLASTVLVLASTTAAQVPGRAVSCTCYCGKVLAPPCSDQACKNACGWRDPNQSPAPNSQPTPSGPTQEELDRQAREREAERVRKEKERKQREDALRKAEEEAKAADFLKKRDEAVTELKGLGSDSKPQLKEISTDTDPCPPSQDTSVVNLCRKEKEIVDFKPPPDDSLHPRDLKIIKGILTLAKQRNWSESEYKRLMKALYDFGRDGDIATTAEILETWKNIENRKITPALARSIRTAQGATLFPAGKQSFNDCGVFALANATGRPYSFIAAMATKNISEGEWRTDVERADPVLALKKEMGGLLNYEVVFLAETLGSAEIVPSADFEKTIRSGRPLMFGITFDNKSGHEVVLSRTFQHRGETWFEMIDSNQVGFRKLYLNQSELGKLLLEKGVAFSPDPGTTPKLLR